MSKLENAVRELLEVLEEEYTLVESYASSQKTIINKQEEKIRETALTLLPVMQKIQEKGYYFKGNNTNYLSARGPILKHDTRENLLYVYSVEDKMPVSIDLYNKDDTKKLPFRKLLEEVDFPTIMDGLLMVLDHHNQLKQSYQESIDGLESELAEYEGRLD